jgi:hypothetical protein
VLVRARERCDAVSLRLQLTELLEKMGHSIKARKVLDEACAAAKGTLMESPRRSGKSEGKQK